MKQTIIVIFSIFAFAVAGWAFAIRTLDQRSALAEQLQKNTEVLRRANTALHRALESQQADDWPIFIEALIHAESRGIAGAVGDNGDAVGVLQLHPGVVADLNETGYLYTLEDRRDSLKSIEMWNRWMDRLNPEHDIHFAMKLHNPRAKVSYHRFVVAKMNELKEQRQ